MRERVFIYPFETPNNNVNGTARNINIPSARVRACADKEASLACCSAPRWPTQ